MASPFTVFRKNQKVLLAITGILAMIAFVFLGTCVQSPGPVQAFENPTVVSWKFGDITEGEMDNRIGMRKLLNHFLRSAVAASGRQIRQDQTFFLETENAVIESMVLARRGRELGIVISDDIVNRELAQLTGNRVPPEELEGIIANVGRDRRQRVTAKQIFDALREELLAGNVHMLFRSALGDARQESGPALDTPAQRWDYFRRLERQATAQVLGVPVAQFTEAVGKPSEEELQSLFEKYKDQFASPSSPEPGFRQPYRARFEYFKADINEMATAEMGNISDAEVSEYYEKHKDTQFRKTKLSPLEEDAAKEGAKAEDAKAEDAKAEDAKAEDAKAEDAKAEDAKSEDAKPDAGKAPVTDANVNDAPSTDKPEGEPAKESNAGDAKDATPAKEQPATASDKDTTSDKSARATLDSPFRLVTFQDDKSPSSAADKEPAPDEKDGKTEAKSETDKPEPVKYRPLEQVRDEIRRTLARERLQKQVEERFAEIRAEMSRYAELRRGWQREVARNPDEPKPKPPDLPALAEKYGLKSFTTDLISRVEATSSPDLDIARSYDFSVRSPTMPFVEWTAVAFQSGNLYRPTTSEGLDGSRFLWWKTDEKAGEVPELRQVRSQVLEAWKHIKARDLAKKQAESYARTVRQAKQPMKHIFAQDKDLPVKEIGPFSWLTRPNVPMTMTQQLPPVYYPEVPGVENPGEEFMETVFRLAPHEVGVAFNHPKSIVYVVQPISFTPSDTVLEQEFMVKMQDYGRYRVAGIDTMAKAQNDWMESLFAEYEVRWHRAADLQRETAL